MKQLWREVGMTIRAAIRGWPETARLCVIVTLIVSLSLVSRAVLSG